MTKKTNLKDVLIDGMLALVLATSFYQVTLAQTSFDIPTLLPGQNENLGGEGDACVGLADMIRSGDIHLRNLPCFIKYFSQTLITVAGSLSVLFVMIGGYMYVLGKDESKDKAKKTITYALIGLAVSLLAWVIVDIVLQVATE
ncbi:MAG: pilin [Candidatus Peregrinibacteria bacterium]